jgi:hypothetical protein
LSSSSKTYLDQPCDRCGSPKKISKTWKEKIITISGTQIVEVSQTVCTNKECQADFDKNREEELSKIEERKSSKEASDRIRKENIAIALAQRKNRATSKS